MDVSGGLTISQAGISPTGNLDSESTEAVYKILRDINAEMGTSFVIITHDRKIAELTDRIIEIKDGRINLDILR